MEPSASQIHDEEELLDIVAARSRGDTIEEELRKLEKFELEAQQREEEQATGEEMGRSFQSLLHHPSTTSDEPMGEEIKEEEKEDDISISNAVQDQIKNHPQVARETPASDAGQEDRPSTKGDNPTGEETRKEEAGLEGELAFPQPSLTHGQNQQDVATMHPGAYAMPPQNRSNESMADDQATSPTDNNTGLVVANQVEENEEPTQIARPDHLHPKSRSTSMILITLILVGTLLIVGVIVGSICGAGLCKNKEGDMETQAPTSSRYFVLEDIQNRIEKAFGPHYFPKNEEAEPTPKTRALDWIVFEDPLQLNPDANNLLQRFILSLTYFQTSQESDWLICSPSTTAKDETCWIQIGAYESWGSRWLTGVHECQWTGIDCDTEKNITRLQLWDNGLNGPLPTELASLPALEDIDLKGNQLTGTVPSTYGSFLSLSSLLITHNQLSGSIPLQLFVENKLTTLSFTNNSLTGTVPTEVGLFDGTGLALDSNSLSGSIPTELFQTDKRIGTFLLNDNMLTGTLPTEIGALYGRNRVNVHLQGNPLRGTIPSEIGRLKGSLSKLDVSRTNMDGSLPEELFTSCTNLAGLWVSNCGLTGTISTGLQLLTKLQWFDMSNNKFHGTIPAQLSALTKLVRFIVNGNDLSGSIPSSVCALADPFKGTFEVAADCLPMDGTGNPMNIT
ncbi:Leucine rich repeat N-terminal domain [Seminavis robusta]|uniref:Leucine rich repeat N-terminal domain n=1 Tax=Seminavis robusta TaxID=568900 RepID=A0A9N8DQY7_9STRA|nr:Leucine rich repeat N-terminal domain [Seminavis robusta]|eukprot:Sro308_g113540.1 Leucine rich repeat N-terminal domain (677) ;mRNA; f:26778-29268